MVLTAIVDIHICLIGMIPNVSDILHTYVRRSINFAHNNYNDVFRKMHAQFSE